jgi:tRNA threonylcarbamoyladenosine biosynthesis protein TsaE
MAMGERLSHSLTAGDVVCLEGELGAGKTVLVRGIARGLGYFGAVQSPTFMIIHTYPEARLCHVDAFRLSGAEELLETGIEEYLEGDWICALEWADRVRGALPKDVLTVRIEFGEDDDERVLSATAGGDRAERLRRALEGIAEDGDWRE